MKKYLASVLIDGRLRTTKCQITPYKHSNILQNVRMFQARMEKSIMGKVIAPKLFIAVKAFIVHDGRILLIRESVKYKDDTQTGKFGEVGGRIKPGERFNESLLREVKEETGLNITIGRPFYVQEWRPVVRGEQWQVIGIFFECYAASTEVTLSADHDAYIWIDPADYEKHEIMDDLYTVFEEYLRQRKEV